MIVMIPKLTDDNDDDKEVAKTRPRTPCYVRPLKVGLLSVNTLAHKTHETNRPTRPMGPLDQQG